MSKAPGSTVLSGAINGNSVLTIKANQLAVDSRYAKIMQVMQASEQSRPRLRRLGDQLGAVYTPVAVAVALIAWVVSADPTRFLAVLVVAAPCPLLIAIPVAIISERHKELTKRTSAKPAFSRLFSDHRELQPWRRSDGRWPCCARPVTPQGKQMPPWLGEISDEQAHCLRPALRPDCEQVGGHR